MKEYTPFSLAPALVGSHNTGEQGVLREVFEGTTGECATVDVHSRSVPTSNMHVVSHIADHLAEMLGHIRAHDSSNMT